MKEKQVRPLVSAGTPRRARIPHHRAHRWLADGEPGRKAGMQVFLTQPVFRAINAHASGDLDNEVGGWLAGRWCRDIDTKAEFVVVEALLPAQQVRSGSTFLTFTHDSQVAMLAALEERYAKKGIVGWYHTHPRMGLFLSGYDVWLHEHFFPYPWQVALVVDPHAPAGGFFVRDGKNDLDSRRYFGFHELLNRKGESIVDWRNLHGEPKPQQAAPPQPAKQAAPQPMAEAPKRPAPQAADPLPAAPKAAAKPQIPPPPANKADVKVSGPASGPAGGAGPKKEEPKRLELTAQSQTAEVKLAVAPNPDPAKLDQRQGVLKKFEGPKPPAKVNLRKKEENKTNAPDNEASASKEAQK
ncbi:MAG TPA: Mov34/MPN/PAD-1 family protein [Anaerolineales bacterium]|nr:Mov34/MPN/PAD-1 family protein [Anaerolineales bacterium]